MSNKFTREILLDGERVTYSLEYKNIKNVNIRCTPAKGLYISAPFHADLKKIDDYLRQNSGKILDAVHKAKQTSNRQSQNRTEQRSITLDGRKVDYELSFKKVKRINLSISADKGVRISAPHSVKVSDIEKFMTNNTDFIIKAIDKHERLSENMPKAKKYCDGEYIYFLGEKRTIRVTKSMRNYAELNGSELRLFVTDPENLALKSSVADAFLKEQCEQIIPKLCQKLYPKFKAKGIEYPREIRFRKMVSCWGNCRPARSILTFNTHLIQLPEKCIEQVICHEFTHFLHANHSKQFYAELEEFMPDWKKYDDQIKELQNEIIIRNAE